MLWCLVVISCARCVKIVIENARHAHVMWIVILGYICNDQIDELATLAEVGGVDRALVAEIKGRIYSSMRS